MKSQNKNIISIYSSLFHVNLTKLLIIMAVELMLFSEYKFMYC